MIPEDVIIHLWNGPTSHSNAARIKDFARKVEEWLVGEDAPTTAAEKAEPVAWNYFNKKTGKDVLTHQPPDRCLFVDDYAVTPLYLHPAEPCAKCEEMKSVLETIERNNGDAPHRSVSHAGRALLLAHDARKARERLATIRNETLEEAAKSVTATYGMNAVQIAQTIRALREKKT